jgi:thiol:disulfide interchange protein DsbD
LESAVFLFFITISNAMHRFFAALLFVLATASFALFPAPQAKAAHVKFSVQPQTLALKPGEKTTLVLTMSIDAGWHTYGLVPRKDKDGIGPQETEISVESPSVLNIVGKINAPKPKQRFDAGFQITVDDYEGTVTFKIPVQAASTAKPGKYKTAVKIYYMVCDDQRCLPPTEDSVVVDVSIGAGGTAAFVQNAQIPPSQKTFPPHDSTVPTATAQVQTPQPPTTQQTQAASNQASGVQFPSMKGAPVTTESQSEIAKKRSEGVWSFLWFAMGAGASALLTPCVFPMVPITVSFFTKRAEKKRGRGLRDSLVYALGIILTFTALGVALSLVFGATGISDFAANPWVNVAIALIFLVLAFNLFGTFEIPLPTEFLNKLNAKSNEGDGAGIGAVLLMGLTFSITSFTCTVPFVGAALISASSGEWFYPIVGMLGFSGVFALPFFLLALFPSALTRLPKAGGWMNNVKVVMGFLEIAAAMKFVSNADLVWSWGVMSREVFLAIWIGCGFMISLYVLGVFRLPHDSPVQSVGAARATVALVFVSITFYLISGLFGKKLGELDAFLPPKDYETLVGGQVVTESVRQAISNQAAKQSSNQPTLDNLWLRSYDAALQEAQRTGRPVFIDFTGFTCTNCRWMEANVFSQPDVQALMSNAVKVQLYTDRREEPYLSNKKMQLERFGTIELPLYVLVKSDGSVIATKAFTRNKAEFVAFLKKAL